MNPMLTSLTVSPLQINRTTLHNYYFNSILDYINSQYLTIPEMIKAKGINFRVSVVGNCNLNCNFCHNEGGPKNGRIDESILHRSMSAARHIGFTRIQFTGGEPLLSKKICDYAYCAAKLFDEVGITTNGVLINSKLDRLLDSGVNRIHISPQIEDLSHNGDRWNIPGWLSEVLSKSINTSAKFRINLPAPINKMGLVADFLRELSNYNCDIEVFSILPYGDYLEDEYDMDKANELVARENLYREINNKKGKVSLRGFHRPIGIRCDQCNSRNRCVDKSHALRLGVDNVLRPCLATRTWDMPLHINNVEDILFRATVLTLDY